MSNRVRDIDPRAEYRDGISAFLESRSMRGAIDSAGHSADDRCSRPHQGARQRSSDALPICSRVACADNRDPRLGQRGAQTDSVELLGWRGEVEQLRWIFRGFLLPTLDRERCRQLCRCRHAILRQAYGCILTLHAFSQAQKLSPPRSGQGVEPFARCGADRENSERTRGRDRRRVLLAE
jgi:hypothetical protein